jgi:hypothetical protein
MSLFELKRQRIFRVFHELTAVNHDLDDTDVIHGLDELQNYNNIESIKFYRADMRPSIPEFFDIGELPLLEGIFGSNPDITHVVHLAGKCIDAYIYYDVCFIDQYLNECIVVIMQ